jgi:hypothetical protein
MSDQTQVVGTRLDATTLALLRRLAESERRTLSNFIANTLADFAAKRARRLDPLAPNEDAA